MSIGEPTRIDLTSMQDVNSAAPHRESPDALLGALDIVEAFTSLRHELKLQVRGGRELQESMLENFQRLEQKLSAVPATANAGNNSDSRKMAEAIAEIEESLNRAIESIIQNAMAVPTATNVLGRFDEMVATAPWVARKFASSWLQELRAAVAHSIAEAKSLDKTKDATFRGLELLLARVHRLMQQFEIERENVLHKQFDSELMNAVDLIPDPQVPSGFVAEQLRPLYRWHGAVLRCAEVRVAS